MKHLELFSEYSRREVHDIFSPDTTFTPSTGSWGVRGVVRTSRDGNDYVFFVTFGQEQAGYLFDENITRGGVFSWQSQPSKRLINKQIQTLIRHNESGNTIYLFLRTGPNIPYTYLGRLKYLWHDPNKERPVYFRWQIIDWDLTNRRLLKAIERIGILPK